METVTRYIESAKNFALDNPVQVAAASVVAMGALQLLSCYQMHMHVNPQKSIIVITGCDSGFGLMSCKKLSSMGYLVVAACLQEQSVEALKSIAALPIQCDITKPDDIARLVRETETLARQTNGRVWTLVNNAGIANSGCVDWVPMSACRKVFEVNFFALFEVTQAFLPLLKKTKNSRVINISSAAGFSGSFQMGVYCGECSLSNRFYSLIYYLLVLKICFLFFFLFVIIVIISFKACSRRAGQNSKARAHTLEYSRLSHQSWLHEVSQ